MWLTATPKGISHHWNAMGWGMLGNHPSAVSNLANAWPSLLGMNHTCQILPAPGQLRFASAWLFNHVCSMDSEGKLTGEEKDSYIAGECGVMHNGHLGIDQ